MLPAPIKAILVSDRIVSLITPTRSVTCPLCTPRSSPPLYPPPVPRRASGREGVRAAPSFRAGPGHRKSGELGRLRQRWPTTEPPPPNSQSDYFFKAHRFIVAGEYAKTGVATLVHCSAGRSRSASLVIAFLMISRRIGVADAYSIVNSKRSIAPSGLGRRGSAVKTPPLTHPPQKRHRLREAARDT